MAFMELSAFGSKFAGASGIVELMDDLGSALVENPDMIMMGGGNPGRLEAAESVLVQRLQAVLADPEARHLKFGLYQPTSGEYRFRETVADFLKGQYLSLIHI